MKQEFDIHNNIIYCNLLAATPRLVRTVYVHSQTCIVERTERNNLEHRSSATSLRAAAVAQVVVDHAHHVPTKVSLGDPLSVVDAEDLHALVVVEVRKELGRDEEILSAVGLAGDVDEGVVYCPFRTLVHALQELSAPPEI